MNDLYKIVETNIINYYDETSINLLPIIKINHDFLDLYGSLYSKNIDVQLYSIEDIDVAEYRLFIYNEFGFLKNFSMVQFFNNKIEKAHLHSIFECAKESLFDNLKNTLMMPVIPIIPKIVCHNNDDKFEFKDIDSCSIIFMTKNRFFRIKND